MKKFIALLLLCLMLASLIPYTAVMAADEGSKAKANEGVIELFQKNTTTGKRIPGGGEATFKYNLTGPTFNFVLLSKGLKANTSYSLIYYIEERANVRTGVLLISGTSDSKGNLFLFGFQDLKTSLPYPKDLNYSKGARIRLVLSSDYNLSTKKMKSWRPAQYLFESQTIRYKYQAATVTTSEITKSTTTATAKALESTVEATTESTKLVCLFFDDGWQNQYDVALPVLLQNNFKATFGIITESMGTGEDFWRYFGVAETQQLADYGMDIASHTKTHPDLTTLDSTTLQQEVAGSKADLESLGFNVRTFVYPYFAWNDTVVDCVKAAGYTCARAGGLGGTYDPDTTDPDEKYLVNCTAITNQNLTQFKAIVDQAGPNSVVCLAYHFISDTGPQSTSTPVANFYEQMSYLKTGGFNIVLLPDLMQEQPPAIAFSPATMTFTATQGTSNPAAQTLNISNSGDGTLDWAAASDSAWLSLSPTSGSSTGSPNPVTVTADISGLSAGTYNGTITITATDATNTPQTVPVTLSVQAPSPNWLTGWNYRKQITIAGSTAGAQTNYQMKLTINRSTGPDSGSTVYLGTNCASDYSDIRFTKDDATTLLDYWIESSDSSTATVWVEFDSIPASTNTANFYLYYGNSSALSASNIQNTFVFSDDFDDGTLDTTRWTLGGGSGGSITEANGVLTMTAGTSNQRYAASVNTYGNAYALHARARLNTVTNCSGYRLIGFVTTKGTTAAKHFTTVFRWHYSGTNFWGISGDGSKVGYADMKVTGDTNYHTSECRRYAVSGTNYDTFIMDGGSPVTGTRPTAIARYIYINSLDYGKSIIVDWIFLRKFVPVEPAWGTWGSEETSGNTPSPTIAMSPATMTFTAAQGGSNPAAQTLNISNSGEGTLDWTAASDSAWLSLSPTSGSSTGSPNPVTVTADISGLSAGTYNGTITITATDATNTPQTVPVTLTVQTPPAIAFSPASMTFTATQGASNPAAQTLNISNSGDGTLDWAAASDSAWLSLSPTSGSSTGSPNPVTVTADISGLSAGTYNGTITITATDATNTPQTVPVTLSVQAPSPNWLTGWNHRKQITIAGSTAGAQTNYQMKLTINRSTGPDSGSTVYLGTNCASDYSDIRFTKDDATTLLDYWIESSDSGTATVWVEFDSIPASTNTANFYLYYDNSSALSASNIQNTFVFADDFDDGTLDTTRWTLGGGNGGSFTETNGVLTMTAGTSNQKYAASINTYNNAYALHARARLNTVTNCSGYRLIGFVTTKGTTAAKHFTTAFRWHYSGTNFEALSGNGSKVAYANMQVAGDTNYHISECRRYAVSGTNYDTFIMDGGSPITGNRPTAIARYIYINSLDYGKSIIVDWIFLRKFVPVEPAWGTWGSEETP